jgi:hypothetical protein
MIPTYRGVIVNGVEALDPASIRSFGLMLSERQQGEFWLEVDTIVAVDASISILEGADNEAG